MSVVNRLSRSVSCVLWVFCSIAVADPAVDHNTTRSNRDGGIDGGGSDVTSDSEMAQRGSGTVKFFNNSKGFGFTAGDQEGHSDSDAIEYGLIAALMSDGDSDAIEYGLIAALMSDVAQDQSAGDGDKFVRKRPGRFAQDQSAGDGDKFVRKRPGRFAQDQSAGDGDKFVRKRPGRFAQDQSAGDGDKFVRKRPGRFAQDQSAGDGDKFVRKRPGRFAQDVGLGGGAGNNGSGTLRNNDPIPGIDVIVEKDPEENPALDNSPVMMLNEMLNAGYSQAEVVEFALATGLIGR